MDGEPGPGLGKRNVHVLTVRLNSLSPCVCSLFICTLWSMAWMLQIWPLSPETIPFMCPRMHRDAKIALQWMHIEPGRRSGSHRADARRWIGRGSREDIGRRRRGSFTSRQASKPWGSRALRIVANCGHLGSSSSLFALGLSQLKETAGTCPDTQRAEPRNAGESVSFGFIWTGVDKQWWASPLRIAASHPWTAPVPWARTSEAEFLDTNTGHCHTNTGRLLFPTMLNALGFLAVLGAKFWLELCYWLKHKVWICVL